MIGTQLGKWRLERELGRGGMGCVYLGRDSVDREAAVKVLAAELSTHSTAAQRFKREVDVLSRLDHPNIVHLYESGEQGGLLYFVMEYVPGRDYSELLRETRRLPWEDVLDLGVQVCDALKHAHDHGVIHRDIKPSNLIRTPEGKVILTDFGVAHLFQGESLTRPGAVVGTAEYLSPEQASGKPATRRSDLYSLGVLLYTLVTGRNPYTGANVVDILHKHRYGQFDPPSQYARDLPSEFEELIGSLLEKDPEKRPPEAGLLQKRLLAVRSRALLRAGGRPPTVSAAPTALGEQTQAGQTLISPESGWEEGEGQVTFVSRMVRQELEAQNRGGPIRQFLNRPLVLALLFVLCLSGLLYTFWPPNAEQLFTQGQALMNSSEPSDWELAWERYFDRLEKRFPEHEYQAQLAEYRAKREEAQQARQQSRMSEGEWFFRLGVHQRQRGEEEAALATWERLVTTFQGIPREVVWVNRARLEMKRPAPKKEEAVPPSVSSSLERAARLRAEGKRDEAEAILQALKQLYEKDTAGDAVRRFMMEEKTPKE